MIPGNAALMNMTFDFVEQPTKTYKMDLNTGKNIRGYTDELEAMKQVIFKILNTERYQYIIYSWNYGIELKDLFGMPISYVCPELERRIKEALTQDSRITDVTDFTFDSPKRGVLHTTFTAHTIFGKVEAEKAVNF